MKKIYIVLVSMLVLSVLFMQAGCGSSGTEMTLTFSFGERTGTYVGEVNDEGLPNGQGSFTAKNSEGHKWTYTGAFVNGHFEGEGITVWEGEDYKEIGTYHEDRVQPEPEENVKKLFKDPEKFKYHYFELVGRVYNIVGYDNGTLVFQMNAEPDVLDENTYVYVSDITDDLYDLEEEAYVRLAGIAVGKTEYENIYGVNTSAVVINADWVEIIPREEALSKTLKIVEVNSSQSQYGYTLTIQKVEFDKNMTRVYVLAENNGKNDVYFNRFGTMAVQDGVQHDEKSSALSVYPDFDSPLKPGNHCDAVLIFHDIEPRDFQVIIEGYAMGLGQNLKDYRIDVKIGQET